MTTISTATGPIDSSELGMTLMHEHIIVQSPGVIANFPVWDRAAELDRAVDWLQRAGERGIRTVVDLTPGDWRDVPFVVEAARQSGVRVIVATGLYYEVPRYFWNRDADHMAALFVRDIREGILGTSVRAAIIKCATDEAGVTPQVEKVLRAAARAHRATGVPISTHTHARGERGSLQQDVFESEGVDLKRVIIGHSGDSDDIAYLTRLMDRGSTIGMDRFGDETRLSTEKRVATIARLCELGHAGRMVLSHDSSPYMDWFPEEYHRANRPNRTFWYISDVVLPALRAAGVTDEQIETMMVWNPRRIFEQTERY